MILSALQRSKLSDQIKKEALNLGFYSCGISKAEQLPDDEKRMEEWLAGGYQGTMNYLERNREKRYDPTKLVDGALSVITVIKNYNPADKLVGNDAYKISAYAYGEDYHKVMKDQLHQLLNFIREKSGTRVARVFVDSAPVLDRAWAHKSGLGFIGKNTMLINRKAGSYFFIGHIILDLELEYEQNASEKNFCGSCSLCIKACPTTALEPFKLDARKCISYLTIEHRNEIPKTFKGKFDNWIFGCDICQDVCPWNREAPIHNEPKFEIPDHIKQMKKDDWLNLTDVLFAKIFEKSAVRRTGFKGLKRNIDYLQE